MLSVYINTAYYKYKHLLVLSLAKNISTQKAKNIFTSRRSRKGSAAIEKAIFLLLRHSSIAARGKRAPQQKSYCGSRNSPNQSPHQSESRRNRSAFIRPGGSVGFAISQSYSTTWIYPNLSNIPKNTHPQKKKKHLKENQQTPTHNIQSLKQPRRVIMKIFIKIQKYFNVTVV